MIQTLSLVTSMRQKSRGTKVFNGYTRNFRDNKEVDSTQYFRPYANHPQIQNAIQAA